LNASAPASHYPNMYVILGWEDEKRGEKEVVRV
jgi:hypothetical protein